MDGQQPRARASAARIPASALLAATLLALAALLATATTAAASSPYARLSDKGPPLRVDRQKLRASLTCSGGIRDAGRAPVLLVPATSVNSDQNFSWNYEPLLNQNGIPWCASDQPGVRNSNLTDIQVRGQYLTYAIRRMHRMAGRPISIIGHSQGGMAMRWSLRFWPDTRRKVDDVIGFAGTNHGTTQAADCTTDCSPAGAQQSSDSNFIAALNSRAETFAPISYTEVYTSLDETVTPQPQASSVSGPGRITNVGIQQVCPDATAEHLQVGTVDPSAGGARARRPRPRRPRRPEADQPARLRPAVPARCGPGHRAGEDRLGAAEPLPRRRPEGARAGAALLRLQEPPRVQEGAAGRAGRRLAASRRRRPSRGPAPPEVTAPPPPRSRSSPAGSDARCRRRGSAASRRSPRSRSSGE